MLVTIIGYIVGGVRDKMTMAEKNDCKIWRARVKGNYKVPPRKKDIKELMCYFLIC